MNNSIILDIKNLRYDIGKLNIINDFSLRLSLGKIIILLGESGCGKTSILNIIAGLKQASFKEFRMQNLNLAYIFQEPSLLPFYTVLKNLELACPNASKDEILEVLRYLNLNEIDVLKYPNELSGGMKTRINFARAILSKPTLMLLDEPFTGINYELKEFLISFLIKYIKNNNKSAIMVTHDRQEALKIADYIYILSSRSKVEKIIELKTPHDKRDERFFNQYKDFAKVYYE